MESVTLNLYGTIPRDDYRYINVVLGLSALSFDNMYIGKLSGERNGKQAFTSINYRTRNTYGILNITPTLKLDYGVTRLSEYTDYISTTIDGPATDIRYAEDTFKSGEFATGFLFETEKNYIWRLYDKNSVNEDDDQLRAVTGICFMFAILVVLGLYSSLF